MNDTHAEIESENTMTSQDMTPQDMTSMEEDESVLPCKTEKTSPNREKLDVTQVYLTV